MSISVALSSALSGLTAAGRASQALSDNLSNVLTRGYARRSVILASNSATGAGVRVLGTERHVSPAILANRRLADAEHGHAVSVARFHADLERLVGVPGDPASLTARLADFEASLVAAASRPESPQRLDAVAHSANALARSLRDASDGLQGLRTAADREIGHMVDRLNTLLSDVQKLNGRITSTASGGGDTAALLDQRQVLIDEVNAIVPVRVMDRAHGQVALFTDGGAILLDGPAATLSFDTVRGIVPEMTLAGGALSGLAINGIPVRTDSAYSAVRGGRLAAAFEIRDELATDAQAWLDAVARDLVERFETPGLDPTAAPGDPGVFTDGGAVFDPALETGLAGRVTVNALVDPSLGGDSWRLRAGLGAAAPGEPGEARQLQAFHRVLSDPRPPAAAVFGTGLLTAAGAASALVSQVAHGRVLSEQAQSFATASRTEASRLELEQGVDSDAELQRLMLVEQAYAANARMLQAADDMMQTLLGI